MLSGEAAPVGSAPVGGMGASVAVLAGMAVGNSACVALELPLQAAKMSNPAIEITGSILKSNFI